MAEKLNELALGYAGGLVSGAAILLLGLLGNAGMYRGAAQMMMQSHMFFSLTPLGIITGIIEAAILGFIVGYAIAFAYNKFAQAKKGRKGLSPSNPHPPALKFCNGFIFGRWF